MHRGGLLECAYAAQPSATEPETNQLMPHAHALAAGRHAYAELRHSTAGELPCSNYVQCREDACKAPHNIRAASQT